MPTTPRPRSQSNSANFNPLCARRASLGGLGVRRVLSVAALAGLLMVGTACDNFESDQAKADKRVKASVDKSVANRKTPTDKNIDAAVAELNTAVKETAAGEARKVQARSLLAQTEYELGDKVSRKLLPVESSISGVQWEIAELGAKIKAINTSIDSINKDNPDTSLKTITDRRAEVAAVGDAADKKAKEIQGQIDQAKAKVAEIVQQQTALRTSADANRAKASKLKGKEQADVLDAVTEDVRKAENLGHEIFKLTGAISPAGDSGGDKPWEDPKNSPLLPLYKDLAAEQAKKKNADDGVASLNNTEKVVKEGWEQSQKQIEAQKAAAQAVGKDLAAAADRLAALEKEAADLRDQAVKHYEAAASNWDKSAADALKLGNRLKQWGGDAKFATDPVTKAWKSQGDTYNNHIFKVLQARALDRIGNRHSSLAILQAGAANVKAGIAKALEEAGVPVPAAIASAAGPDASKAAAVKSYDEAIKIYGNVFEFGLNPQALKDSARISNMLTLYCEYQITGDQAKLKEARTQFAEVFSEDKKSEPKAQALISQLPADLKG